MSEELTPAALRERVWYYPETGEFRWVIRRRGTSDVAGAKCADGYVKLWINGRRYFAHRLAWFFVHDKWPDEQIDHINGNRDDNRIANLRDVPANVNRQNRRGRVCRAGLRGVQQVGKRFSAFLSVQGRPMYLGRFDTAEEAHAAYVAAKRQHHEGCTL